MAAIAGASGAGIRAGGLLNIWAIRRTDDTSGCGTLLTIITVRAQRAATSSGIVPKNKRSNSGSRVAPNTTASNSTAACKIAAVTSAE